MWSLKYLILLFLVSCGSRAEIKLNTQTCFDLCKLKNSSPYKTSLDYPSAGVYCTCSDTSVFYITSNGQIIRPIGCNH